MTVVASNTSAKVKVQLNDRYGWLQVARGTVQLNGEELRESDGVQMPGGQQLEMNTANGAELLLFNLA